MGKYGRRVNCQDLLVARLDSTEYNFLSLSSVRVSALYFVLLSNISGRNKPIIPNDTDTKIRSTWLLLEGIRKFWSSGVHTQLVWKKNEGITSGRMANAMSLHKRMPSQACYEK